MKTTSEYLKELLNKNVERIASDYTGGRKGVVVSVDSEKMRAQVNWKFEKSGSLVNGREKGLTTWVKVSQLILL